MCACVCMCVSSQESWASSALLFQRNWRRPGGNYTPLLRLVKTSSNQVFLLQSGIKHTHAHARRHISARKQAITYSPSHIHNAVFNRVNGEKIIKIEERCIEGGDRRAVVCGVSHFHSSPFMCCAFVCTLEHVLLWLF